MKKGKFIVIAAAAVALVLSGCFGGSNKAVDSQFPVAKDVSIPGSPLFEQMKKSGQARIGVKNDLPGLSYQDPATNQYSGFDIEIAKWITASLGLEPSKIEFKSIPNVSREQAIINGDVDMYISSYSITDRRKEQIGFAGPYFVTGQGLLVRKDSPITGIGDMNGKTVCATTGSTPIQNIRNNYPQVKTIEFSVQAQCIQALLDGKTDAVTTDEAILLGNASVQSDKLKVVGEPFSVEKYGIGLQKSDNALRHYINKILTDGRATWKKIYDETLGKTGVKGEDPQVDNYS